MGAVGMQFLIEIWILEVRADTCSLMSEMDFISVIGEG